LLHLNKQNVNILSISAVHINHGNHRSKFKRHKQKSKQFRERSGFHTSVSTKLIITTRTSEEVILCEISVQQNHRLRHSRTFLTPDNFVNLTVSK